MLQTEMLHFPLANSVLLPTAFYHFSQLMKQNRKHIDFDSRNAVGIAESRRWRELAEEEQRREVSSQEERFGHAMVSNSDFDDNRK